MDFTTVMKREEDRGARWGLRPWVVVCLAWVGLQALDAPLFAKQPTSKKVMEKLKECKEPLSDKNRQDLADGLSRLSGQDLDEILAVASSQGPPACRGLAIAATGEIAAREPGVTDKVVRSVVPFLSDPQVGQAPIHAIVRIGPSASEPLIALLDKQDETAWKGMIVILQNLNNTRLPADSELRSTRAPGMAEGRAKISAQWARWWRETGRR